MPQSLEVLEVRQVLTSTVPFVESIVRNEASSVSAASVTYTVTFSVDVSGVDATDFRLAKTGTVTGGTIDVTPTNASVYVITISGLSGTGTLGLNLFNDFSIQSVDDGTPLTSEDSADLFTGPTDAATGKNARSIAIGDVDEDGHEDFVVASFNNFSVEVYKGAGDGTFSSILSLNGTDFTDPPTTVVLADVNDDEHLDVVVTLNAAKILTFLGDGDGGFDDPLPTSLADTTFSLQVADLYNDGHVDLLYSSGHNVYVMLGDSTGSFGSAGAIETNLLNAGELVVGHFNGDSYLDFAVLDHNANTLLTYPGGLLGFGDPETYPVGASPAALAVGDVNNDGELDLVAVSSFGAFTILLNNGDGTFTLVTPPDPVDSTSDLALADLNGDSQLDLIVVTNTGFTAAVEIILSGPNGSWQVPVSESVRLDPYAVAVGDFNEDDRLEFLVAEMTGSGGVEGFLNASGDFTGEVYTLTEPTVNLSLSSPASVTEAGGVVTVTATLSSAASADVTINLNYSGTATNVNDYTRSGGQIVITAGNLTGSVTLTGVDDTTDENNETVIVTLGTITGGASAGTTNEVTATFEDDDDPPFANIEVDEDSMFEVGGEATVTITLSQASEKDVDVTLLFTGGSGVTDDDFRPVESDDSSFSDFFETWSVTLRIAAGQTQATFTIVGIPDSLNEPRETLTVSIDDVENALLGDVTELDIDIEDFFVDGIWYHNGVLTSIIRDGNDLILVNERGEVSEGHILSDGTIVADDWGGLVGTLTTADRIEWGNNSVWTRPAPTSLPTIATSWSFNGTAEISQDGDLLTFTNEHGGTSSGYFLSPTQLVATNWNLTGTLLANNLIEWSNGSMWTNDEPTIDDDWTYNGSASVTQIGSNLTFINEHGGTSSGHFTSPTEIVADDWGLTGTLSGDGTTITWSNGSVWTSKQQTYSPPALPTNWGTQYGALTTFPVQVSIDGQILTLVNEFGNSIKAQMISETTFITFGWGNVFGTFSDDFTRIEFSNGSVWTSPSP